MESTASSAEKPKWYYDLTYPLISSKTGKAVIVKGSTSTKISITGKIPDPPGFTSESTQQSSSSNASAALHTRRELQKKQQDKDELKLRRAREVAFGPAKSAPMNLVMSYFSGNSLQVIPLSMTWMMFFNGPLKQLVAVNDQFTKFETESNASSILMLKAVYIFFLLATIGVGFYKLSTMGILPNTVSDWVAWELHSTVSFLLLLYIFLRDSNATVLSRSRSFRLCKIHSEHQRIN